MVVVQSKGDAVDDCEHAARLAKFSIDDDDDQLSTSTFTQRHS